jgi:glycosyltransferase involved in cell wall biosynthesis
MGLIGRITASKNPLFLLDILGVLRNRHTDARVLFMGYGPEEEKIRQVAAKRGIGKHITFLPPGENVAEILSEQLDVLVLPSDFEGTPRVVTEAQACGVPVVCSTAVSADVCAVPELFHRLPLADGAEAWADGILRASQIRVPRQRIERCFARSPLEIGNQADLLVNLYENFLNGG